MHNYAINYRWVGPILITSCLNKFTGATDTHASTDTRQYRTDRLFGMNKTCPFV